MKILWVFLLACGAACAQGPLTLLVCNVGCSASAPVPSPYNFLDVAQYSDDFIQLRAKNTSTSKIKLLSISLSGPHDFSLENSVTIEPIDSGQMGTPFSLYFTPQKTGSLSTTMTATYCFMNDFGTCGTADKTETVGTFQGVGTAPAVVLSCSGLPQQCNGAPVAPESHLDFGYVLDGGTKSVMFTVTNGLQSAATVSLQTGSFSIDAPAPIVVPAGASVPFSVNFSPLHAASFQATLLAGSTSFLLEGTGVDNNPSGPLQFQNCSANCVAFTSPLTFPDTGEGAESDLELKPINPGNSKIKLVSLVLTDTKDFSLGPYDVNDIIAPGLAGMPFVVHFTPQGTGALSATLIAFYCYPDASGACGPSSETETVAKFAGIGAAPAIVLSCKGAPSQCDGSKLRPATTLDFGNVVVGTAGAIQFTLKNSSQEPINVALQTPAYLSSPFSSDPAAPIPATVAAGSTATFTVDFSPGQAVLSQATLVAGAGSFPLQGTGVAATAPGTVPGLSSLVVSYTDAAGVRQIAQGGAIDFGQVVTGTSVTLNVSVCNPRITIGPVTLPVPSVSGSGFTASGLPPGPVSIPNTAKPPYCEPGDSTVTFPIVFTASTVGNYTGALSMGTLKYALKAQDVAPPLAPGSPATPDQPSVIFQLDKQLTSGEQVDLTLKLTSPAQGEHIPVLAMSFAPSVQGVGDDPAIRFLAYNQTRLSLDETKPGTQTLTYNKGQSEIAFQTGTTAGTLTFTLTDAAFTIGSQSFDILPEKVHIASATATLSSPNIVVTINGYDNTYSLGQLSFTFYDKKGNAIAPGPISVDANPEFHQWFFKDSKVGGAFGLKASFPVENGDASAVGSVAVKLNNSEGTTTTKLAVQ